jgi:hypothetical protein
MSHNSKHKQMAQADRHGVTAGMQGIGSRIAPAVALLLFGDAVHAESPPTVPEPSTLGLVSAGMVVGGLVVYIRNKRRK